MNDTQQMARPAQKPNTIKKSKVGGLKVRDQQIKIQGLLTSRIETKNKENQPYYGFFKIKDQATEISVIFKDQEGNYRPTIAKGSQVELTGQWAKSNNFRPSFTCQEYQILKDPPELTIQSLREIIQPLLRVSKKNKQAWINTTDFLFKKWEELKKIEQFNKLGSQCLQAYLLLKMSTVQSLYEEQINHGRL